MVVVAVLKTWVWKKYNPKYDNIGSFKYYSKLLINFWMILMKQVGVLTWFYLFFYSGVWYFFYKFQQTETFYVPSVNDVVDAWYYAYFKVFSFLFYLISNSLSGLVGS